MVRSHCRPYIRDVKTTSNAAVRRPVKSIAIFSRTSFTIALIASSCGTVCGFGRDVGVAGDKIEHSSHSH